MSDNQFHKPSLGSDRKQVFHAFTPLNPMSSSSELPEYIEKLLFEDVHGDEIGCFALLDAAQNSFIPELLESSGLQYRCLYSGEARKELGNAAPWLVKLDPENSFTIKILTEGAASWHLWDKGLGVIFIGNSDLDEMHAHLRRFTKVRDGTGKWYFFRYWERATAQTYFSGLMRHPESLAVWCDMEGDACLGRVIVPSPDGLLVEVHLNQQPISGAAKKAFALSAEEKQSLDLAVAHNDLRQLAVISILSTDALWIDNNQQDARRTAAFTFASLVRHDAITLGIDDPADLTRLIRLSRVFGLRFYRDPRAAIPMPVSEKITERLYAILDCRTPLADILEGTGGQGGLNSAFLQSDGTLADFQAALCCSIAPKAAQVFWEQAMAISLPVSPVMKVWCCFYAGCHMIEDPRYASLSTLFPDEEDMNQMMINLCQNTLTAVAAEPLARPL